ncbi:Fibroblast growth factor receptor 4 [Mactra antiquata]
MLLLIFLGGICLVTAENCSSNCLYGETFCNPSTFKCTYGCKPGWIEPYCKTQCGTEGCKSCSVGDKGEYCTSCESGVFGPLCNIPCSANCLNSHLDNSCDYFGNCLYGCEIPFTGPQCLDQDCPFEHCRRCDKSIYGSIYCSYCTEGLYWHSENNRCVGCPNNCLDEKNVCDRITGECVACKAGWFGKNCEFICEIQDCRSCQRPKDLIVCRTCNTGKYPSEDGLRCLSCDDRHCLGTCDPSNGNCKNGCQDGWYGAEYLCNRKCTLPYCEDCVLNYYSVTECLNCVSGYYLKNEKCEKCPETCIDGLCDNHSPNCRNGCVPGHYGSACEYQCSPNCVNSTCEDNAGYCQCTEGWYGTKCDRNCPVHCVQCEAFVEGKCKACEPRHYGPVCEKTCSPHCQPNSYSGYVYCDQDTGKCKQGCVQGYFGDTCDGICNKNCESQVCDAENGKCTAGCTQNHYGDFCENPCPEKCLHVLVGYKRTCNAGDGRCLEGCEDGWFGDFCNKTCNKRCKNKVCDQWSGECLQGCSQEYTGVNCDIICRTECNNDCSPNCYNNECNRPTQTCSAGCRTGWYGSSCLKICNKNCYAKSCEQISGNCLGSCIDGFYGVKCDMTCNTNCIDNACDKFTGTCSKGCRPSFYGDECADQCPGACRDNLCDRWTGHCTSCGLGRRGNLCTEDCILGTFGENCKEKCGQCYDSQPCNTVHGSCPSGVGCKPGYTGVLCKEALQSQGDTSKGTYNLNVVIGCSIAGFIVFIVLVVAVIFYTRTRNKTKLKTTEVPVVVYREANVTIRQPGSESSSMRSDTLLLGDSDSQLTVNLQQEIYKTNLFTLYYGNIVKSGRTQSCCVRVVKLTESQENNVDLTQLTREYEILTSCGSHLNIIQLLTSYQNKDVYCAALDSCVETGLVPYLSKLRSHFDNEAEQPVLICKMLRFAIDVCSAISHIHRMKITHRLIQAKHVYLTDSLVAKLGDFYWAEQEDESLGELPADSYPWLPIEALNNEHYSQYSDVWSFGVTFWEICTGAQQPFENVSMEEYKRMILDGFRLQKPATVPFSIYRVMKNCWRYRSFDRPTADQVLTHLLDLQPRFSKDVEVVYI